MKVTITLESEDVKAALLEWVKSRFKEFENEKIELKQITADNGSETEPQAYAVFQITLLPF